MLECKGHVRNLDKAPGDGTWLLKTNRNGIPYIASDKDQNIKRWAMSYFQDASDSQDVESRPLDIDLDRVDDDVSDMPMPEPNKPPATATTQTDTPKSAVQGVNAAGRCSLKTDWNSRCVLGLANTNSHSPPGIL